MKIPKTVRKKKKDCVTPNFRLTRISGGGTRAEELTDKGDKGVESTEEKEARSNGREETHGISRAHKISTRFWKEAG